MNKNDDVRQANQIILLHKGDIVKNAIEQQQKYLYKTKTNMLNDLITLVQHNAKWYERAEALDDYIMDFPDELDDWLSTLIDIGIDNDIYIDDILEEFIGDDEKKMFALEKRLTFILKECITKL